MSEDRSDVAPKVIGVDLHRIATGNSSRPSHEFCPGGSLAITRDEYDGMVAAGEHFVTPRKDMSADGDRSDARLYCRGTVMRKEGVGGMVFYGLCASCAEAERRMRERARHRVETNGR